MPSDAAGTVRPGRRLGSRLPWPSTVGHDPANTIEVLDHGFVALDDAMADDLSVVNAARVSFTRRRTRWTSPTRA